MVDSFEPGEPFDGEQGLKTGAQLENLVRLAVFKALSGALDQITLDDDGSGKARIKDLGVSTDKLAAAVLSADATGLSKMAAGYLSKTVDGLAKMATGYLQATSDGLAKMEDGYFPATAAGRAKFADGLFTQDQIAVRGMLPPADDILLFRIYANSAQVLTKSVMNVIELDGTTLDYTGGDFDTSSPNFYFKPTVAGMYVFGGSVMIADVLGGRYAYASVLKNGAELDPGGRIQGGLGADMALPTASMINMNGSTDYVQLGAYHNAAVNKASISGPVKTYMYGWLVATVP
jgi:hypothetical protein